MVDSSEDLKRDVSIPDFVFKSINLGFGRPAVAARASWAFAAWASAPNPRGLPVLVERAYATLNSAAAALVALKLAAGDSITADESTLSLAPRMIDQEGEARHRGRRRLDHRGRERALASAPPVAPVARPHFCSAAARRPRGKPAGFAYTTFASAALIALKLAADDSITADEKALKFAAGDFITADESTRSLAPSMARGFREGRGHTEFRLRPERLGLRPPCGGRPCVGFVRVGVGPKPAGPAGPRRAPVRCGLRGLSGPEVRRTTSSASGCLGGLQRVLLSQPHVALPLAALPRDPVHHHNYHHRLPEEGLASLIEFTLRRLVCPVRPAFLTFLGAYYTSNARHSRVDFAYRDSKCSGTCRHLTKDRMLLG